MSFRTLSIRKSRLLVSRIEISARLDFGESEFSVADPIFTTCILQDLARSNKRRRDPQSGLRFEAHRLSLLNLPRYCSSTYSTL